VLPVAIMLTFTLIITSILNPPHDFAESIPLLMLAAILGLPAILILITTRKLIYITWMLVYLLALPIWNFVLPTYAYWHFDDFSWGETRKVEGESKGDDHGKKEGQFDRSKVPLKRWEDWERTRIRRIKRKERQRQQLESGSIHLTHLSVASEDDFGLIPPNLPHYDDDETSSIKSGISHDPQQYYEYSGGGGGGSGGGSPSQAYDDGRQEEYPQQPSQLQYQQQQQRQ
jgi:chitin synthase